MRARPVQAIRTFADSPVRPHPDVMCDITMTHGMVYDRVQRMKVADTPSIAGPRPYIGHDNRVHWAPENALRLGRDGGINDVARTNLLEYTDDFSQSYWTKTGLQPFYSADNIQAAGMTLQKMVEDTSTGQHRFARWSNPVPVGVYTVGAPFLVGERSRTAITIYNSTDGSLFSRFNLLTGEAYNKTGVDDAWVDQLADGVCVCWLRVTTSAASDITVYMRDAADSVSYTGDGVSGLYIGDPTLVEGAYYGPPLPSPGAGTMSYPSDMGKAVIPFDRLRSGTAELLAGTDDCTVLVRLRALAPSTIIANTMTAGVVSFSGVTIQGLWLGATASNAFAAATTTTGSAYGPAITFDADETLLFALRRSGGLTRVSHVQDGVVSTGSAVDIGGLSVGTDMTLAMAGTASLSQAQSVVRAYNCDLSDAQLLEVYSA